MLGLLLFFIDLSGALILPIAFSFRLRVVLQVFKSEFASSEVLTIVGGFVSALSFFFFFLVLCCCETT